MTVAESIKFSEDMPYDWDEVLVLDPDWSIRPDDNRAVQTNRDPATFIRGLITTERAVLTALLDGNRTLSDLAVAVSYLFDLLPAQARDTVRRFAKDTLVRLVRLRDIPEGRTIPVYDPAQFARAGAKFPRHRRLKSPITITWMPTLQCGTNCLYCYMNRRPIPANGMLPDKRVRQLLEEVIGLQIPAMLMAGGDPFAHPHILDYLDILIRAGVRVQISTKMTLTRAQVMRLADIGVKEIQFSIDGPNATTSGIRSLGDAYGRTVHANSEKPFNAVGISRRIRGAGLPVPAGSKRRPTPLSVALSNHYCQAVRSFCRRLVQDRRVGGNAPAGMSALEVKESKRSGALIHGGTRPEGQPERGTEWRRVS
jgi:hypothetical protein